MTWRPIEHADPWCVGGWSALAEDVPLWAGRLPGRVELICWTCGRLVQVIASTPAIEEPDDHGYDTRADVPAAHRPGLAGLDRPGTTRRYPASVNPVRVATGRGPARVVGLLHIEAWSYDGRPDSAFCWLVTDLDGNVLGAVTRTIRLRGTTERYEWGSVADVGGHGGGFGSPETATRALLRAVYGTGDGAR